MGLKYKLLTEFKKDYPNQYAYLCKNGWLEKLCDDMGWDKTNIKNYWTKERCIKEALNHKNRNSLKNDNIKVYEKIKRNKWQKECFSHMETKRNFYWTKERCIEEALKYNYQTDLVKNSSGCFDAIIKNKWQKECFSHMNIRKHNGYWTKERCIKEALKFKKIKNLRENSKGCYNVIIKNKWREECFSHMI